MENEVVGCVISIVFGVTFLVASYIALKLRYKNEDLRKQLCEFVHSSCYESPIYLPRRLRGNSWAVWRYAKGCENSAVLIKVFDDEDEKFNYREALGLCSILNEK
ncbi:MAG: hypothetical protein K2M87_05130 [Muribaculaceae bacterium]|nr:hypothetical protein [Muribaculaceae bacterium]